MLDSLIQIISLEENGEFETTHARYVSLYADNGDDYEVWKYYYFFLWAAIEDAPSSFHTKINLTQLLVGMLQEGKDKFATIADFNFIAGYTVSIFPYEYGDYETLEEEAQEMLLKAKQLEPGNSIYKLFYLGGVPNVNPRDYHAAELKAAPQVHQIFKGPGILNKYFRRILSRLNPSDYR